MCYTLSVYPGRNSQLNRPDHYLESYQIALKPIDEFAGAPYLNTHMLCYAHLSITANKVIGLKGIGPRLASVSSSFGPLLNSICGGVAD